MARRKTADVVANTTGVDSVDLTDRQWLLFRVVQAWCREHTGKYIKYKDLYAELGWFSPVFVFKMNGQLIIRDKIEPYPEVKGNPHDSLAYRMMREDWSIISSCELIPYVCMASPAGLKIPETIEEANAYQVADDCKIQRMRKIYLTNASRIKNDIQGRFKFTPCSKEFNDAFFN